MRLEDLVEHLDKAHEAFEGGKTWDAREIAYAVAGAAGELLDGPIGYDVKFEARSIRDEARELMRRATDSWVKEVRAIVAEEALRSIRATTYGEAHEALLSAKGALDELYSAVHDHGADDVKWAERSIAIAENAIERFGVE